MMHRENLNEIFDRMTPSDEDKNLMKERLRARQKSSVLKSKRSRKTWLAVPALSVIVSIILVLGAPLGGRDDAYAVHLINSDDVMFRLEDGSGAYEDYGTYAHFVNSRPSLRFFIEGQNIAKVEIEADNEYLTAHDWTETQHEKYWNVEYYQQFDEQTQMSILDPDKLYHKNIVMTFDEGFTDYDKIWYEWDARNLYEWAREDNFARFIGYGVSLQDLQEEEKLAYAAGDDGSPLGHIYLEGYPEELLQDTITIRLTDREGNVTSKVIFVQISNNEIGQTVVAARLAG